MKVIAVFVLFCLLSVVAPAVVASAQAGPVKSLQSTRGFEVSTGYSMLHDKSGVEHGIGATAQYYVSRYAGAVVDMGVFRQRGMTAYLYSGGPQFIYREGPVQPFARILVGGLTGTYHGNSAHAFMYGGGGGVDVKLARGLYLRASEDFLHASNNNGAGNSGRLGLGITYRIGTE